MKSSKPLIFLIALILSTFTLTANARIVCWTNKDGVKECGDKVPPEYAQKDRQVLNEQGLVIDEKERAKTEEELAAEKEKESVEAEKLALQEEQARHDKILLDTFSNVDDINMARDGKIAALETTISLTEKRNEKLQTELNKLVEQAAAEERAGKAPSEDLVKDIEALRRQIDNNNNFISDKRTEQETVKEEYAKNVARFKELKSIE